MVPGLHKTPKPPKVAVLVDGSVVCVCACFGNLLLLVGMKGTQKEACETNLSISKPLADFHRGCLMLEASPEFRGEAPVLLIRQAVHPRSISCVGLLERKPRSLRAKSGTPQMVFVLLASFPTPRKGQMSHNQNLGRWMLVRGSPSRK